MRRRFLLFPLILSILGFSCASTAATTSPSIKFKSDYIGPFPVNCENVAINIDFYTTGTLVNTNVKCGFEFYRDGAEDFYKQFITNPFTVSLKVKPTIKAILPFSGEFPLKGVNVRFFVLNNDKIIYDLPFRLYPYPAGTLNPALYDINLLCGTVFKLDVNQVIVLTEYFNFNENVDSIVEDSYYRLNIDQFDFEYGPFTNPNYDSAELLIINPGDCFSSLKSSLSTNVIIPLRITYIENRCHLSYLNTLYVDPKTLMMSRYPKVGYLATNHFYFPINRYTQVLKEHFQINIYGFGPTRRTISWNIKYLETNYYIGECSIADYCVIGGVL